MPLRYQSLLFSSPHRHLRALAYAHRIPGAGRLAKADLVAQLIPVLSAPHRLKRVLAALPPAAASVLDALAANDGRMPRAQFEQRYGRIAPPPANQAAALASVSAPIEQPPGDLVVRLGLAYPMRERSGRLAADWVVLPLEVANVLSEGRPALLIPTPVVNSPAATASPPATTPRLPCTSAPVPFHPTRDVAYLLAWLHAHNIRPLHGRWLPPRHVQQLAAWLMPPADPAVPPPDTPSTAAPTPTAVPGDPPQIRSPSERHYPRLAMAHCLAEATGLIAVTGGRLALQPAAWSWLSASRPERWRLLWNALDQAIASPLSTQSPLSPLTPLWQRFRLPGHQHPQWPAVAQSVLHQATTMPIGAPLSIERLATVAEHRVPSPADLPDDHPTLATAAVAHGLITGPLAWLGVFDIWEDSSDGYASLTPNGAWLIQHPDGRLPAQVQPPSLLRAVPDLVFSADPHTHPAAHLALAQWADPQPQPGAWQITLSSLRRAASALPVVSGRPLDAGAATPPHLMPLLSDLLSDLAMHTQPPTSPADQATLAAWLAAIPRAEIAPALLLRVPDGAARAAIAADHVIKRHVAGSIPPDALLLATDHLDRVLRRLDRLGIVVHHPNATPMTAAHDPAAPWLLTAARVLAALAPRLGLPLPAGLAALLPELDGSATTAATAAADELLARLEALIDISPTALNDEDDIAHTIRAALSSGHDLRLHYRPESGHPAVRTVTPNALSSVADGPALLAYCHLRRADRTFRLDRIQSVVPVPQAPPATRSETPPSG